MKTAQLWMWLAFNLNLKGCQRSLHDTYGSYRHAQGSCRRTLEVNLISESKQRAERWGGAERFLPVKRDLSAAPILHLSIHSFCFSPTFLMLLTHLTSTLTRTTLHVRQHQLPTQAPQATQQTKCYCLFGGLVSHLCGSDVLYVSQGWPLIVWTGHSRLGGRQDMYFWCLVLGKQVMKLSLYSVFFTLCIIRCTEKRPITSKLLIGIEIIFSYYLTLPKTNKHRVVVALWW